MNTSNRRLTTRVYLRIPMQFRCLSTPALPMQDAESVNLSERGVYFETDVAPAVGTPVELVLRMPFELTGRAPTELRCVARVIHVHQDPFSNGRSGVGVYIVRYETMLSVERQAS
jgi:hypothetical protein